MKKLLFILALLNVYLADGQTVSPATGSGQHNTPGSGSFSINVTGKKGVEIWNVNYFVTPLKANNQLDLYLGTFNTMAFSADIVDGMGKKVLSWEPATTNYKYHNTWDISSLTPGNYHVIIYDQNKAKVQSISFEKA